MNTSPLPLAEALPEPRALTCFKCGKGGTLRKFTDDRMVCQECYAKDAGIEVRHSKGRPIKCPDCGADLMTRFRKGRVSISTIETRGNTAVLKCKCGYRKSIRNPFSSRGESP